VLKIETIKNTKNTYSSWKPCCCRRSSAFVWAKRNDSLRALAAFRNSAWAALPPSAKKPGEKEIPD